MDKDTFINLFIGKVNSISGKSVIYTDKVCIDGFTSPGYSGIHKFIRADNPYRDIIKTDDYNETSCIFIHDAKRFYNIKNLCMLPSNLTVLICINSGIMHIPSLPSTLIHLELTGNKLIYLPELPDDLDFLNISDNYLRELPKLPSKLVYLIAKKNNLSKLPKLPPLLKHLNLSNNRFESLTIMDTPSGLEFLLLCNNLHLEYMMTDAFARADVHDFDIENTPVSSRIDKYYKRSYGRYMSYQYDIMRVFVIKIENWFLECKYDAKYKYCRERLIKEHNDLYNS